MFELNNRQEKIILLLLKNKSLQSSSIHSLLGESGEKTSLITIKRDILELRKKMLLNTSGAGRATTYSISTLGRVFTKVDADDYTSTEPDRRFGNQNFNFDLLTDFPRKLFSDSDLHQLRESTIKFKEKSSNSSDTLKRKELERLVIELSWKSSRIEGNTYTLLDTERLIRESKPAKNKTKDETQMILNHKDAFLFVYENRSYFKTINSKNLQELHKLLVKGLGIDTGFRKSQVGITGSIYMPLDNVYQIEESVKNLTAKLSEMNDPFSRALLSLVGISYIQPFEDGNKRTSRIMANAILLANNLAPLSYRSIDEESYRNAMLTFYELNTIVPMKKIFSEQYIFATKNYFLE